MTTELAHDHETPPRGRSDKTRAKAPGDGTIALTRGVLFWEGLGPALLHVLAPAFIILVFSLFGLWRFTPAWLHWTVLALATAATAGAAWRKLAPLRWPSRRNAQARLEENGGVRHAPLQALDDKPFKTEDVNVNPLWRAHLAESAERARGARFAAGRETLDAADPYALRFVAIGVFLMSIVAAGDDWRDRLALAVSPGAAPASGTLVADIWIEPPDYTGRAPVYLARAGAPLADLATQVDIPQGSSLIAQINGVGRAALSFTTPAGTEKAPLVKNGAVKRADTTLTESGVLRLTLGAKEARWPIGVVADAPPQISFQEAPVPTEDNLVLMVLSMDDDYGVASAELVMRLDPDQERPLDAPAFDEDALAQTRRIALDNVGGIGPRAVELDLQEDPWAGLQVIVAVSATDGAGQIGETSEARLTLPTRPFFNPLARAVIEQRQTLAVAANEWSRAGRSFDALTLAPEFFYEDMTDYLLLRTAFWRVMRQRKDGFEDAVEKFWPLAMQLEDEALELARQRLEAAQEALRQALENGASDKEIERLVEELRQAMNDYLTALAQSGDVAPGGNSAGGEQLDQSDLDEMLDSIRDLSQQGAQNAARQMLSDLSNLLNNLRMTQGGGGSSGEGQSGAGGGAAGEAGDLIGRQRELADSAFQRGQTPGANGDDLASAENALGGDLDQLIDELTGAGGEDVDPDGSAARALGGARNEMRQAEQALRNGDFAGAASAMERAIERLRDGAGSLAREQMRQAAENEGQNNQQSGGQGTDPLGRPTGYADGDGVDVPGETAAGRTRAVLEELRRRLGEQGRDEEEVDYLERLLERF